MKLGFTFTEVHSVRASASKVVCCHFSSDGKLLASGGHDKKVKFNFIKQKKSNFNFFKKIVYLQW